MTEENIADVQEKLKKAMTEIVTLKRLIPPQNGSTEYSEVFVLVEGMKFALSFPTNIQYATINKALARLSGYVSSCEAKAEQALKAQALKERELKEKKAKEQLQKEEAEQEEAEQEEAEQEEVEQEEVELQEETELQEEAEESLDKEKE